ncbi:hypothetical protein DL93DRAFT_1916633 [Clavulina sp. PMI_390]|nr:hypothetical protein DL93DRAFT_1916633 [Clavulina sp. PMI_390]
MSHPSVGIVQVLDAPFAEFVRSVALALPGMTQSAAPRANGTKWYVLDTPAKNYQNGLVVVRCASFYDVIGGHGPLTHNVIQPRSRALATLSRLWIHLSQRDGRPADAILDISAYGRPGLSPELSYAEIEQVNAVEWQYFLRGVGRQPTCIPPTYSIVSLSFEDMVKFGLFKITSPSSVRSMHYSPIRGADSMRPQPASRFLDADDQPSLNGGSFERPSPITRPSLGGGTMDGVPVAHMHEDPDQQASLSQPVPTPNYPESRFLNRRSDISLGYTSMVPYRATAPLYVEIGAAETTYQVLRDADAYLRLCQVASGTAADADIPLHGMNPSGTAHRKSP